MNSKFFSRNSMKNLLLYERILREHGIHIASQLLSAEKLETDKDAIENLGQLNLRLRMHMDNVSYMLHVSSPFAGG